MPSSTASASASAAPAPSSASAAPAPSSASAASASAASWGTGRGPAGARRPGLVAPALTPFGLAAVGGPATVVLAGRTGPALLLMAAVLGAAALGVLTTRCVSRRAEWALAGMLVVWVGYPVTRLGGSAALVYLSLAGAVGLTLLALAVRRRVALPAASVLVTVMFAVLLVSTAGSLDQGAGIRLAVSAAAFLPAVFLAPQLDAGGRAGTAAVVVCLGAVQAAVAVAEPRLWPALLRVPALRDADGLPLAMVNEILGAPWERSQGTLGHPLPLGLLLVVGVALLLARATPPLPALWRTLLVALMLAGLVLAGARASFAMGVVLVLLLAAGRPTWLRAWCATAVAGLAVAVAVATQPPSLASTAESGSFLHRMGALQAVGPLLDQPDLRLVLFGSGYGAVPRISAAGLLQNSGLTAVDNQLVTLLVQGGVVAAGLMVALVALGVAASGPRWRPALVCVAVSLLLYDLMLWPASGVLLALLLGLALSRPAEREP